MRERFGRMSSGRDVYGDERSIGDDMLSDGDDDAADAMRGQCATVHSAGQHAAANMPGQRGKRVSVEL